MPQKGDKSIRKQITSNPMEPAMESLQFTSKMIRNYLNQNKNNNTNPKKYYFSMNKENALLKFDKIDKYFDNILDQVFNTNTQTTKI
jgi:hypothetical protein